MPKQKTSLLIITEDDYVARNLERQLKNIFTPHLNTSIWFRSCKDVPKERYDLAICATKGIYQEAKRRGVLEQANDAMVITRHLSSSAFERLDQIFSIPPYTEVLVCANTIEAARLNMSYLQQWGVTHLNMVPYTNGLNIQTDSVKYAIVFGYTDTFPTCPPNIKTIIDLGPREFDFQSIVEIIQRGRIWDHQVFLNNQLFMQNIMGLASNLAKARDENLFLNEQLKAVLQRAADNIIMLDQSLRIVHTSGKLLEGSPHKQNDLLSTFAPDLYRIVSEIIRGKDRRATTVIIKKEYYLVEVHNIFVRNAIVGHVIILNKAKRIQKMELDARCAISEKHFEARYTFDDILTKSPQMENLITFAKAAAQTESNIVIYGETGVGKEMLAQSIHNYSNRAENAFVPVNVSAVQDDLIESELFGYEDGAFTGARKGGKPGLFELADKGTLFLDEIGELSLPLQAKLLRAIQEKEVVRLGGTRIIPIDIRLITATNRELYALVRDGKFRQDLYYRINVLPVRVIPLRQRRSDIDLLLEYYSHLYNVELSSLPKDVYTLLRNYDWPGNVRELQNVCDYISNIMPLYLVNFSAFKEKICEYLHIDPFPATSSGESEHLLEKVSPMKDFGLATIILTELLQAQSEGKHVSLIDIYRAHRDTIPMSVNKIRKQAALLHTAGLIEIGRTRQGTQITERGKKYLASQTIVPQKL